MTTPFRTHQRRRAGACAAVVAALATIIGAGAATAVPAFADAGSGTTTTSTPPTTVAPAAVTTTSIPRDANRLDWIQANAARLIANRVASLGIALKVVQGDSFLGADGTTLATELQTDISGLQALGTTISGDTSAQQAAQGRAEIFSQFRVYLLVLPVVHDVITVDRVTGVLLPAVQSAITKLQGDENSSNQSVIGPLVADIQTQAQIATSATAGLSAQLMAFTPAQWDANHKLLSNVGSDIRSADRALQLADKDVKQAERYLEHAGNSNGNGGGPLGHRRHHGPGTSTSTTSTTVAPTVTSPSTSSSTTSTTTTSTTTTPPLVG